MTSYSLKAIFPYLIFSRIGVYNIKSYFRGKNNGEKNITKK